MKENFNSMSSNNNFSLCMKHTFLSYECIPKYANSILPRMVPSICCTSWDRDSSVSVFDNSSLSNTLGKNTAIASSSSSSSSSSLSAETRTPSKNISENNLAVASSSPSSSEINLHLHHLILRRII